MLVGLERHGEINLPDLDQLLATPLPISPGGFLQDPPGTHEKAGPSR